MKILYLLTSGISFISGLVSFVILFKTRKIYLKQIKTDIDD